MTPLQSINQNIEALRELINSLKENRTPEQNIINQYSGFGNIKDILLDPYNDQHWDGNRKMQDSIKELHELLKEIIGEDKYEQSLNHLQASTLTSYYTPNEIILPITDAISNYANQNDIKLNVLEPSSGSGAFIKPLVHDNNIETITSIEKDHLTAWMQQQSIISPKLNCIASGYEEISRNNTVSHLKYNCIISNIPFGNFKVFDPVFNKQPNSSAEYRSMDTIHGYYFIKSIDLLEKNGILAFITSTGIADSPSNDYLRKDMLKKCELLTAIRLPNNTFTESGTKVVSDLIILKKRTKSLSSLNDLKESEKDFLNLQSITITNNKNEEITNNINSYFLNGLEPKENLLGTFAPGFFFDKQVITIQSEDNLQDISKKLTSQLEKVFTPITIEEISKPQAKTVATQQLSLFDEIDETISTQIYTPQIKQAAIPNQDIYIPIELLNKHNINEGNLYVHENIIGKIEFTHKGPKLVPLKSSINRNKAELAFNIINDYKQLIIHNEINPFSEDTANLRDSLNKNYKEFVIKFGNFHERKNLDIIQLDVEGFKLKGLEIIDENNKVVKSDIFYQQNTNIEGSILSIKDAVNASLNVHGEISIDYISTRTNLSQEQIIKTGLDDELFFLNPETNSNFNKHGDYTCTEEIAYSFVPFDELISGPVRFKIEELTKHQASIPFLTEDLFNQTIDYLNKHDIPRVSIEELECKLGESWIPIQHFNNFASELLNTQINVTKNVSNSSYSVNKDTYTYENNNTFAVECKNGRTFKGTDLLLYAMHGTSPRITYTVKYSDSTSQTFIDRDAMSSMQMKINQINNLWKEFVLRNPDISTELENLYNNTQNIDVERVYNGEHLTFPGLTTFQPFEHQKNGVWQMISQNGGLVDHEVGAGKTLLMTCQAMEMKRLGVADKTIILALKANTLDIYKDFKTAYPHAKVLCPTDADYTPENRLQFFQKIQNNNWDAIIMTHDQFAKIPQSREIQLKILSEEIENLKLDLKTFQSDSNAKPDRRQIKGLQVRIENKTATINKLSESLDKDPHLLTFDKMGVNHLIVDESQQFKNLEYSTRHSRVAGMGSPDGSARALNMLMAVRTIQEMNGGDRGVTFCSGTSISNSLIELYLLKKYLRPTELVKREMKNFDAWARSYAELSRDFEIGVTNEVKPKERFRSFQKVPELARFYRSFTNVANKDNLKIDKPEISMNLVEIPSTDIQKQYSQELIKAVQNDDFGFFGIHYSKEQLSAKMLLATNLSSKMAMDMRLVDPTLDLNDGSKLIQVAQNINDIYVKSNEDKGTQLVFCDTSTPKGKSIDQHHFNLYTELKKILVDDYNIPKDEIEFIHYHDSKPAKKELFNKVNEGKVRIVLGSTEKMGVGVNMQKRVVAMHHLDIPWRPSDFSQRIGRGQRQGNILAKEKYKNTVQNFIYATSGTLDAYKYFLVDLKQKFIDQIKQTSFTQRSFDEGDMDEDGMSPAAFIAQLSGKKELLEKTKIDKNIQEYELKRNVLKQEVFKIEQQISYANKTIPLLQSKQNEFEKDLIERNKYFNNGEELTYSFETNGKVLSDKETISKYLKNTIFNKIEDCHIGSIGNFDLNLKVDRDKESKKFTHTVFLKSKTTDAEYYYGNGIMSIDREGSLYRYAFDTLKGLENSIQKQITFREELEQNLKMNQLRLPQIDINQFDEQIVTLRHKSEELALIIENDNNTFDSKLKIQETVLEHLMKRDYRRLDDFYTSNNNEEKESIIEFIKTDDRFDSSVKDAALNRLIPNNNNTI